MTFSSFFIWAFAAKTSADLSQKITMEVLPSRKSEKFTVHCFCRVNIRMEVFVWTKKSL